MKNILLTIAYDGTGFSGWQRQPNARTVQGELERVLSVLCRQNITINGTSRTDAGVHALGQRASFTGDFGIPADRIAMAANHLLAGRDGIHRGAGEIEILEAVEVPLSFHARFDCLGKTYVYRLRFGVKPDLFLRDRCYQIPGTLDVEAMRQAAAYIKGTHDFRSFMTWGGKEMESYVRTVSELQLIREGDELRMEITGDGFLYNMVRIIMGTLVEVGMGRRRPEELPAALQAKDRSRAGHTAPPQGLYLARIYYERES